MLRLTLSAATVLLAWASGGEGAHAQSPGSTTMIIPGRCQSATVNGRAVRCGANPRVVYMNLPNGITMLNVALADGRVLAFVGDRDRQPRPEEYWLYLTRVRMGTSGQSLATDVAGTCKMLTTTDGSVVHSVKCEASDLSGSKLGLDFRGDGRPVDLSHR